MPFTSMRMSPRVQIPNTNPLSRRFATHPSPFLTFSCRRHSPIAVWLRQRVSRTRTRSRRSDCSPIGHAALGRSTADRTLGWSGSRRGDQLADGGGRPADPGGVPCRCKMRVHRRRVAGLGNGGWPGPARGRCDAPGRPRLALATTVEPAGWRNPQPLRCRHRHQAVNQVDHAGDRRRGTRLRVAGPGRSAGRWQHRSGRTGGGICWGGGCAAIPSYLLGRQYNRRPNLTASGGRWGNRRRTPAVRISGPNLLTLRRLSVRMRMWKTSHANTGNTHPCRRLNASSLSMPSAAST